MDKLPFNLEAEQALLGALLVGGQVPDIEAICFYDPIHSKIFDVIKKLSDSGKKYDVISVRSIFQNDGSLEEIGGSQYFASIINAACDESVITDYSTLIQDLYSRRYLIDSAQKISLLAQDGHQEVLDIQAQAVALIEGNKVAIDETTMMDGESMLEAIYQNYTKPINGFRCGISDIDKSFGSFGRGKFVVIGARPAMGKSAFGLTLAHQLAKSGAGVGFDSMDMDLTQIQARMMSMIADQNGFRIEYEAIERKEVPLDMYRAIGRYMKSDEAFNSIVFNGRRGKTINEVIANAKAFAKLLKAKGRTLDVLFIDHIQCIDLGGRDEYQALTQIIRKLKTLAQRLNCCIVAFSQLNRDVEKEADKTPQMKHLRATGAIEEEADAVMFLKRPIYYTMQNQPDDSDDFVLEKWKLACEREANVFEIYTAKNRQGRTGKISLFCDIGINRICGSANKYNVVEFSR